MIKISYFAAVHDRGVLPKTFYGQDIGLLQELGYQVSVATRIRDLAPRSDLIFAWWFGSGVRAVIAAQLLRRPCIVAGALDSAAFPRPRHERFLIDFCVNRADTVAAWSRTDFDVLRARSLSNCYLLPPGLSVAPRRIGRTAREPIVLSVGTVGIGGRRRLDCLLQAIALIHLRLPRLEFHFIGNPGPGYDQLVRMARELGIESRMRMRGRTSFETRDQLYRHALMLVHPVQYEDLGVAQMEAMSQGLPVLTSRCPLTVEIGAEHVTYCDCSRPASIARAIVALALDNVLWEQHSAGALHHIEQTYPRRLRRDRLRDLVELTLARRAGAPPAGPISAAG